MLGKSNLVEEGLFPPTGHGEGKTGQNLGARTDADQPFGNNTRWLHLCGLLSWHSYTTQGHLARGGPAHNTNRQGPQAVLLEAAPQLRALRPGDSVRLADTEVDFSGIKALEQ